MKEEQEKFKNYLSHSPYIIAKQLELYLSENSAYRRMNLMVNVFTQITRYWGCIFLCDYLSTNESDPKVNNAIRKLLRPSLGCWKDFVYSYVKFSENKGFVTNALELFEKADSLKLIPPFGDSTKSVRPFDAFIHFRNHLAHGGIIPNEIQSAAYIEFYEPYLFHIIDSFLPFFDEYKVARCLSVENSFSTSVAEFEILLPGKNEFIEIESEEEFEETDENSLWLIHLPENRLLSLSDIFSKIFSFDEVEELEDEEEKFLTYDGITNKSVIYLGALSQHKIEKYIDQIKTKFLQKNISLKWNAEGFSWNGFKGYINDLSQISINIHIDSGKYNPSNYLERKYDSILNDFLRSDKTAILLSAEAGMGKTSAMCYTAEKAMLAGHTIVFINGQSLTKTESLSPIFSELVKNALDSNSFASIHHFLQALEKNRKDDSLFLFFIDAINEAYTPIEVFTELDQLINLVGKFSWIKIIMSVRKINFEILYDRLVDKMGKNFPLFSTPSLYYSKRNTDGVSYELKIEEMSISDLVKMYEKYSKNKSISSGKEYPFFHQLKEEVRNVLKNPLHIYLYFEFNINEKEKEIKDERDLYALYFRFLLEKEQFSFSTKKLNDEVLKIMFESKSNELLLDTILEINDKITKDRSLNGLKDFFILSPYERLKDVGIIQERYDGNEYKVTFVYQKLLEYLLFEYLNKMKLSQEEAIDLFIETYNWNKLPEAHQSIVYILCDSIPLNLTILSDIAKKLSIQKSSISNMKTSIQSLMLHLYLNTSNTKTAAEVLFDFIIETETNEWLPQLILSLFNSGKINKAEALNDYFLKRNEITKLSIYEELIFLQGRIMQYQSKMEEAINYYKQALILSKNTSNEELVKINIVTTLRQSGKLNDAIKEVNQLIETISSPRNINHASALIQKGLCEYALKNSDSALKYYYEAQNMLDKEKDRDTYLYNLLGISTVLEEQNKIEESIEILNYIYNESNKYGYYNFYVDSMNGLSKKYLKLNKPEKAIYWAKEGLKLWEYANFYRGQLVMCAHIISALTITRDPEKLANEYIEKGTRLKEIVKENLLVEIYNDALQNYSEMLKENK